MTIPIGYPMAMGIWSVWTLSKPRPLLYPCWLFDHPKYCGYNKPLQWPLCFCILPQIRALCYTRVGYLIIQSALSVGITSSSERTPPKQRSLLCRWSMYGHAKRLFRGYNTSTPASTHHKLLNWTISQHLFASTDSWNIRTQRSRIPKIKGSGQAATMPSTW